MLIDYVTANADMSQVQHAMYLTRYNKISYAYSEMENAPFDLNCRRDLDR